MKIFCAEIDISTRTQGERDEAFESTLECKSITVLANQTLNESYFTWCSAAVFILYLIFRKKGKFPHFWECIMISNSIVDAS